MPFEQLRIKASFSLNDLTHFKTGNQQEAGSPVEPAIMTLPSREVNAEEVTAAVLKYAENKQNEGSRQIATILKTAGIRCSGGMVSLTLNNETQKEQFLLVKQQFVDEIRLSLQSSSIQVEIEISQDAIQARAYKPGDVFKAMSEKNPALLELKKRFELEIDY